MLPIKVMQVANGASGTFSADVEIFDAPAASFVLDPANATAEYRLDRFGTGDFTNGAGVTESWTWLKSGRIKTDYEVMFTLLSGTNPTGETMGAWLDFSGPDRAVFKTQAGVGVNKCKMRVDLRRVSDGVIIDTATVTMEANVA